MNTNITKNLALFDFDGTITYKDSFLDFIRFAKGKYAYFIGMTLLTPLLVMMFLKIISTKKAKEIVLNYFFGQMSFIDFQHIAEIYSLKELPKIVRRSALHCIEEHRDRKDLVFIVTASPENWIAPWVASVGLAGVIGTKLDVKNGKITGKLASPNCKGIEKVNRVKEQLNLDTFDQIYAYGDTKADLPLLALAQKPFYRKFK